MYNAAPNLAPQGVTGTLANATSNSLGPFNPIGTAPPYGGGSPDAGGGHPMPANGLRCGPTGDNNRSFLSNPGTAPGCMTCGELNCYSSGQCSTPATPPAGPPGLPGGPGVPAGNPPTPPGPPNPSPFTIGSCNAPGAGPGAGPAGGPGPGGSGPGPGGGPPPPSPGMGFAGP